MTKRKSKIFAEKPPSDVTAARPGRTTKLDGLITMLAQPGGGIDRRANGGDWVASSFSPRRTFGIFAPKGACNR